MFTFFTSGCWEYKYKYSCVFKIHVLSVGRSSPAPDPLPKSPPVEASAPLASSVSGTSSVPVSRRSPITARPGTASAHKAPDAPEQRRGENRFRLRSGFGHATADANVVHLGFQSAGESGAKNYIYMYIFFFQIRFLVLKCKIYIQPAIVYVFK